MKILSQKWRWISFEWKLSFWIGMLTTTLNQKHLSHFDKYYFCCDNLHKYVIPQNLLKLTCFRHFWTLISLSRSWSVKRQNGFKVQKFWSVFSINDLWPVSYGYWVTWSENKLFCLIVTRDLVLWPIYSPLTPPQEPEARVTKFESLLKLSWIWWTRNLHKLILISKQTVYLIEKII